ncbi:hypothetical protein [Rosenbergiella nectarea]|uniref:hypothetical protein n=1 Tax=Rosenbergiella nectarea TaxID=988801 RepID=UPI001F4D7760|nr:hypothetical protein [Rosenbergiella nectarea]
MTRHCSPPMHQSAAIYGGNTGYSRFLKETYTTTTITLVTQTLAEGVHCILSPRLHFE